MRGRSPNRGRSSNGHAALKHHSSGSVPVWSVNTESYDVHYATFPRALIAPCILAGSRPGDVVLDPFGGTSTTGVVAERFGAGG